MMASTQSCSVVTANSQQVKFSAEIREDILSSLLQIVEGLLLKALPVLHIRKPMVESAGTV